MVSPTPSTFPPSDVRATLYDGLTARARAVEVAADADSVTVTGGDIAQTLPLADLRRGITVGDKVTLHRSDAPDWRLLVDDVAPGDWPSQLAPVGRLSPRARSLYAAAGVTLLLIIGALWLWGGALLALAAPLVPHRVTEPIGRGIVAEIGTPCTAPAGRAALDRLVTRLTPKRGFAEPVTVTVIDLPIVNAIALPGGHVAVFRQLIAEAASPQEFAGVLAHEFTHVDRRHPNQALLRQMGVSLAAKSIGGDTGGAVDLALLLQSTRGAESAADAGAIALLHAADISPAPLADFFDRQRHQAGKLPPLLARIGDYAATHPADADRAAKFRAAAIAGTPAMTAGDWEALKKICKTGA